MSLNERLKCPGLELTLAVRPQEYPCPSCGQSVEIRTDERKRRCPDCGMVVLNPNPMSAENDHVSPQKDNADR